mgnify:CR=1 FL=1
MNDKNKFEGNSRYFTISIYSIITVLVMAVIIRAVFLWESTSATLNTLLSTLSPFFIGILIAFLINPLVSWMRKTVFKKWLHIRNDALNRLLAILFSYLLVIGASTVGLIFLIPEVINSLTELLNKMPAWANSIMDFINSLSKKYPDIDFKYIQNMITNTDSTLQNTLSKIISGLTTTIVATGVSVLKFIFNFIVAIIVSCYLIIDKKMQARGIKRVVFAFFKQERAEKLWNIAKRSIRIFSNFLDGKMIDSLIIGILCFICMMIISFFGVPGFAECALLVSIVVGVTNMIPYFGPFLGGIPCVLLLCIYSLQSAIVFGILIIIIQQMDGNLIGPKILGDSTGLRPLWIIFAITIGGWFAGVVGMLLGVPCVAVITGLMEDTVDRRLAEKNIDLPILKNEKVRQGSQKPNFITRMRKKTKK